MDKLKNALLTSGGVLFLLGVVMAVMGLSFVGASGALVALFALGLMFGAKVPAKVTNGWLVVLVVLLALCLGGVGVAGVLVWHAVCAFVAGKISANVLS